MKRILILSAALSAAIFASCVKQEMVDPSAESIEFSAVIPDGDESKTSLGAKNGSTYPLTWSEGDQICVNGIMSEALSSGSGTKNATFKVSGLGSATSFNVTYPGKAGSDNIAAFPTTASLTAPVLPMYGTASSNSLAMNHLAALLKFSFTASSATTVTSIELSTPGGEPLSGELTIGKTSGSLDGTLSGGQANVSVNCGSGISLSSSATAVMVPIPAGTFSQGIKVTLTDNSSKTMTVVVLNGESATAGKVYEFNTVAYKASGSGDAPVQIYNTATLQNFISIVNGSDEGKLKNAIVTADFTVSSSDAASLSIMEDYKGTFNGNNKTISGLVKPLFNTLYGQIRNLTLNSAVSISDDDSYAAGLFARDLTTSELVDEPGGLYGCTAKGSLTWAAPDSETQDHAVGGLVGRAKGGIISHCDNQATVTITGTSENQICIGGVLGRGDKDSVYGIGSDVSNCTNTGTVDMQGGANIAYIGGVTGADMQSPCSLSESSNTGTVKVSSTGRPKTNRLGGVVGLTYGACDACTNNGPVVLESGASSSSYSYIGGVVGDIGSKTKTYTNLKNLANGDMTIAGHGYHLYVGGVCGWHRGCTAISWDNAGDINLSGADAYSFCVGGLVGLSGNRVSSSEQDDKCKHGTFTDCTTTGGTISTSATTQVISSSTSNPYALSIGGFIGKLSEGATISGNSSNAMTISVTPLDQSVTNKFPYYIGGIVGEAHTASNASTTTGIAITGVTNNGNVSVLSGTAANNISIAGIVGYSTLDQEVTTTPLVLTDCVNKGSISNAASTGGKVIYVGGMIGRFGTGDGYPGMSMIRCINGQEGSATIGAISNSGDSGSATISVGGVGASTSGGAETIPVVYQGCRNYGPVTNSGKSTSGKPGSRVGGVVGWMDRVVTANGTSASDANRNINYGTVTESSGSTNPCVGGAVGYINNAATDASYIENQGTVNMTPSSSITMGMIGGAVGYVNVAANLRYAKNTGAVNASDLTVSTLCIAGVCGFVTNDPELDHATNSGNIEVSGITVSGTNGLFMGGILSYSDSTGDKTWSNMSNSGSITLSGTNNIGSGVSDKCSSCGGIMGGRSGKGGKTLSACTNTGVINLRNGEGSSSPNRNGFRMHVGGVVGCTNRNPVNSSNNANVTVLLYHYENSTSKSCIGGVIGYFDNTGGPTIEYLSTNGTIQSTGTSPSAYISGIIGRGPNSATFSYCNVAGKFSGAGSSPYAGLFISPNAANTNSFNHCNVKSGTVVKKSSNVTIKTTDQLTMANFCGGTASTGTITDCAIN